MTFGKMIRGLDGRGLMTMHHARPNDLYTLPTSVRVLDE